MNTVHQATSVKQHPHGNGMQHLAEKVKEHHLHPMPEAEAPDIQPFPRIVLAGLLLGIVIGGALGWIFSRLLLDGTVVIPGSEGLFSMYPYAFRVFWIGMGVALGLVLGGIGAIVAAPADLHPPVAQETGGSE